MQTPVDVQIIAIEAENQILFSVHKRMENRPNIKISLIPQHYYKIFFLST